MTHSTAGTLGLVGGKECVQTLSTQVGFALFGPYRTLGPGRYSVTFKMRIPRDAVDQCGDDVICCVVDIAADFGTRILQRRTISARYLKDHASVSLAFALDEPQVLEFRVYVTGAAPLVTEVDREVVWFDPQNPLYPLLESADAPHDEFFANNFGRFRDLLYNCGAEVLPSAEGTTVNFCDLRFHVMNSEDFQLIWEIFHLNAYNFCLNRDVCVLDIGMNIGLASLYFAKMENVKVIYAFEPFPTPFARALQNFGLNPSIRNKIKPQNYGISDTTRELTVRYDKDQTISTSVKGSESGEETTIRLRDIAEVISEIVSDLELRGLDLVIKMDCEGSEFPIMERLDGCGLINRARIFMIEWHKWWSAEKTQLEIIRRLLKNGFDVLDHTNPFDPYAGQLYAVRSGSGK